MAKLMYYLITPIYIQFKLCFHSVWSHWKQKVVVSLFVEVGEMGTFLLNSVNNWRACH